MLVAMPRRLTSSPANVYLPTLKTAKAAHLLPPGEQHSEMHKLCALVVLVRVLERKQWREDKIIRWRWARTMSRNAPPVPNKAASTFATTLQQTFETYWCTKCQNRQKVNDKPIEPCGGCGVRARVLHTSDKFSTMYETYIPRSMSVVPEMFGFESMLERRTTPSHRLPPDALECPDLRPQQTGGAYRTARSKKAPTFHGYDFAGTIEMAQSQIERFFLGKDVARFDIRAWAWPLLWLRYDNSITPEERVIFVDANQNVDAFVGVRAVPSR